MMLREIFPSTMIKKFNVRKTDMIKLGNGSFLKKVHLYGNISLKLTIFSQKLNLYTSLKILLFPYHRKRF